MLLHISGNSTKKLICLNIYGTFKSLIKYSREIKKKSHTCQILLYNNNNFSIILNQLDLERLHILKAHDVI